MSRLQLFSEPFARTGNISAEGFRNLLGRPTLDLLKTAIRESFQNSMDAARRGYPPQIMVRVRTLTAEQRAVLSGNVLGELPRDSGSGSRLAESLAKPDLRVLEIADFGTSGLSGPTRADIPSGEAGEADFVNFMRNVGAVRDVHHGGGTYGYGKTSLYAMSACATILADSETTAGGRPIRRVMACHLGAAHDAADGAGERRRYTGRHWWGIADGEGGIDPAEEELALAIATSLGMPERKRGSTGTTILILDPLLADEDGASVQDDLIETVLWNFWPRMTDTTPRLRKLDFRLEVEGQDIPVPRPEEFPPLDLFAAAMDDVRSGAESLQEIRSQRPAKSLGNLAIRHGMSGMRRGGASRENSSIPAQSRHIALMRPVELVVRYVEGEPFADRRYEWAGVFVCSGEDEVEEAFARAEPPAHDDWIPENLPRGPAKTWVNVAMKHLKQIAQTHANPGRAAVESPERGPSLAATATRMGRVLDQSTRSGPGREGRQSSASKRKTLAVSQARFVRLEPDEAGRPVAIFAATLTNDGSSRNLEVIASPHLTMDGGAATAEDLPDVYSLAVQSMRLGSQNLHAEGSILRVGTHGGELEIAVPMPPGAAVGVRLSLQEPTR